MHLGAPGPTTSDLGPLLDLPRAAFPPLFSSSVLSTIATTLASCRRSRNLEPATMTFRSVVATAVVHLCACDELDTREGINRMFQHTERPIRDDGEGDGETDSAERRRSLLRGAEDPVRDANLSILRRDDKLRWIFGGKSRLFMRWNGVPRSGSPPPVLAEDRDLPPCLCPDPVLEDNFQRRASTTSSLPSTSPLSSPPPRSQTTMSLSTTPVILSSPPHRPASMSSFESLASAFSQTPSSSASRAHRRVHSTSSSIAPLLPSRVLELPSTYPSSPVPFANFTPAFYSSSPRQHSPPPFTSPSSMPTYRRSPSSSTSSSPTPSSMSLSRDTLSPHARRELVRKSKKLNRMFGVPLEERAAEEVLVRPSPRRYSFPPGSSPTSRRRSNPFAEDESSASMGRSNSSPISSVFPPGARSEARGSVTDDEPASAREERRRKLDKVQRLLGERVPAGLVLADHPGAAEQGAAGMARGNSRLGGIWKGLGFYRKREGTAEGEGELDVLARRDEMPDAIPVVMVPAGSMTGVKKGATPVQELARSRKMEQVGSSPLQCAR